MTESSTGINSPELEQMVSHAFLFDVDGVITNPTEKKVTENELFDNLTSILRKGIPVTLNTGRSNEWMIERVIKPLVSKLKDKSVLNNFFAVGEKGLTWVAFDESRNLTQGVFDREGKLVKGFDLSVFLNPETVEQFMRLENEVKELIENSYSHSTFFDSSKKAMISTEMHDGYSQPQFASEQPAFTQELKKLLERERLENMFKIDPTTIATDIQIPDAGKHLGAKRILDWLMSKNIKPSHFITIGDSSSDLEMADELSSQGKPVDFYYVNPGKPLLVEKPYRIVTSQKEFGEGTVETLKDIKL